MKKNLFFLTVCYFSLLSFNVNAQWTQKANTGGGGRSHSTGFGIGTKGYISCGVVGSTAPNDLWEYDPSTNVWTQKANMGGVGRQWPVSFSIGSKGYVGTGLSSTGVFLNDLWEYNPSTNTWTQKANFGGTGRELAVGFCIGTKGYIGTGFSASGSVDDFWEYDPTANNWTQKASFGGGVREGAIGFGIGSKGYVGTGRNGSGFKNDFWEYDPAGNGWTPKTNFGGTARRIAAGFSFSGKGYIGTGHIAAGNAFVKDFWEYDPVATTWTQKADVGFYNRAIAIGFSVGSKGYIGTGTSSYFTSSGNWDFYEYDPAVTPALTTGSLSAAYCAGTSATVPYSSAGFVFAGDNIFTAQLSDASGSFASPVTIGTLTSFVATGNISATIPNVSGSGYRVRVVSSNPAVTGSNNGTNIAITDPAALTITGSASVCNSQPSDYSINLPPGTSISWSASPAGKVILINMGPGSIKAIPTGSPTGSYTLTATATVCGSTVNIQKIISFNTDPLPYSCVQVGDGVCMRYVCYPTSGVPLTLTIPSSFFPDVASWHWTVIGGVFQGNVTDMYVTHSIVANTNIVYPANGVTCFVMVRPVSVCNVEATSEPFKWGIASYMCRIAGPVKGFKVSPNPAASTITVTEDVVTKNSTTGIFAIDIIDKTGMVKKRLKYAKATKSATIDISNLPSDYYVVRIFDGKTWQENKILIIR